MPRPRRARTPTPLHRNHRHRTDPGQAEAQKADAAAERRTVIVNNKAWRAEPVRREHLSRVLSAKRPPTGTMRYLVTALMNQPESFGRAGTDNFLATLTGTKAPEGWGREVGPRLAANANDNRLPLVLLAQHAADVEGEMDVHTWRHRSDRHAAWLTYLATTGYHPLRHRTDRHRQHHPRCRPRRRRRRRGAPTDVVVLLDRGTDDPTRRRNEPAA